MSLQQYIETKKKIADLEVQLKTFVEQANKDYWELDGNEAFGATLSVNTLPKSWQYSDALESLMMEVKRRKKIEELDGTAKDVTKPFDVTKRAAFKVKF